jgi:tRNA/rRNA methyltransferase
MSAELLSHIRIVLSHTSHPGNIGAAARAMKTMGISSLYLVNPKKPVDAEAEAMASGASDVLHGARVCASLAEALQGTVYALAVSARRRELHHRPMRQELWHRGARLRSFSAPNVGPDQ